MREPCASQQLLFTFNVVVAAHTDTTESIQYYSCSNEQLRRILLIETECAYGLTLTTCHTLEKS